MKLKTIIIVFSMTVLISSCQDDNELTIKNSAAIKTPSAVIDTDLTILRLFSTLASVSLNLSKDPGVTGTVTLRIVDVVTGLTKGTSTIPINNIPTYTSGWVSFNFPNLSLLKGRKHRMELECSDKNSNQHIAWYASNTNYLPGQPGVNGSTLSMNADFCFITYGKSVNVGGISFPVADQYAIDKSSGSYVVNISGLTYWQEFIPRR